MVGTEIVIGATYGLHRTFLSQGKDRVIIISPFIKVEALRQLVDSIPAGVITTVVARWKIEDLIVRVSDTAVYPFLKERGIQFRVHPGVHLKVVCVDERVLLVGSSNITGAGLGLSPHSNIEATVAVPYDDIAMKKLEEIVAESVIMTDEAYATIEEVLTELSDLQKQTEADKERISAANKKIQEIFSPTALTYAHFPYTGSPDELYSAMQAGDFTSDVKHDINLLGISRESTRRAVLEAFARTSAYNWQNTLPKNLSFGAYSALLHATLADGNELYRKDIKILVQNMFSWSKELPELYSILEHAHTQELIRKHTDA